MAGPRRLCAQRGDLSCASFLPASAVAGSPWRSLAVVDIAPVSAPASHGTFSARVSISISSFLMRTPVVLDRGPTLLQYNLISTNLICKILFPNKVSSWGSRCYDIDISFPSSSFTFHFIFFFFATSRVSHCVTVYIHYYFGLVSGVPIYPFRGQSSPCSRWGRCSRGSGRRFPAMNQDHLPRHLESVLCRVLFLLSAAALVLAIYYSWWCCVAFTFQQGVRACEATED